MVNLHRQISSVVVPPEFCGGDHSFVIGSCFWTDWEVMSFFDQGSARPSSISLMSALEFIDNSGCLGIFVDWLDGPLFYFFFGEILLGVISEGTVEILGTEGRFPRLVVDVVLLLYDGSEVVFLDHADCDVFPFLLELG